MPNIRIVCISDTHGQHARLEVPGGDVLIHAGDFMSHGLREAETADFNRWLGEQPHRHKIVIAGNHDVLLEGQPGLAKLLLTHAIYLENSGTDLLGLKFWGSPVQPEFNHWAFNVERGAAIRRYWDQIPENTDVLITHGPPMGLLDQVNPLGPHLGCEELAIAVTRVKPRLHIFGHIHGGRGEFHEKEGTHFINVAVLNESYELVSPARVVEVEIGPAARRRR